MKKTRKQIKAIKAKSKKKPMPKGNAAKLGEMFMNQEKY